MGRGGNSTDLTGLLIGGGVGNLCTSGSGVGSLGVGSLGGGGGGGGVGSLGGGVGSLGSGSGSSGGEAVKCGAQLCTVAMTAKEQIEIVIMLVK